MSSRTVDPRHYRSRIRSGVRLVTQDVLMHRTVWTMCKVHVYRRELLDTVEAPYIVVANHTSHLDAPLIFGALPHRLSKHLATGAAADYWFKNKAKGTVTSLFLNTYPVERKGLRTRKGLTGQLLDEGIPLLIFPEGTRSRTGAIGRFTPGVAALSISHGVPVIPVAIVGAFAAWPYYRSIPPTNRPDVHVVFGHPLTPVPGEIAHQFADRMQRIIAELHDAVAKAYKMPTLTDYERAAVLSRVTHPAGAGRHADADSGDTGGLSGDTGGAGDADGVGGTAGAGALSGGTDATGGAAGPAEPGVTDEPNTAEPGVTEVSIPAEPSVTGEENPAAAAESAAAKSAPPVGGKLRRRSRRRSADPPAAPGGS